jgi:ethanolamine kinase
MCPASLSCAFQLVRDVVFSHQDLLCGNILYHEGWDRVQFIDFEYGGYNFRGNNDSFKLCVTRRTRS